MHTEFVLILPKCLTKCQQQAHVYIKNKKKTHVITWQINLEKF